MKKQNMDEILKLYNDFIFFVDTDSQIVESVMDGKDILGENLGYEEFSNLFRNHFELTEASAAKMLRFLTQLKIGNDEIFSFEVKYDLESGEKLPMIVKGKRISQSTALLSFLSGRKVLNKETDGLTKLYTVDALKPLIRNATQQQIPIALLLFDIDNFQEYNQKYGNIYGDILLVETAAAIKKVVKTNGYIARESGDRFLIMLYVENDYDLIHAACTNIRNSVMDLTNHNVKQANITATIGCVGSPRDGDDFDLLYKKAFMALQRGKRKGRNCFIIYFEDKCGKADDFILPEAKFDYSTSTTSNFNIVAGVYEIINRNNSKDENIRDALSLIGTYFLLDRINFFILNPEIMDIIRIHSWHNPMIPERKIKINQTHLEPWHKTYNNLGMVKLVQVDSNKDLPIYDILKQDDISALLAIDLLYTNIEVGLLRFEMANSNRFWTTDEIATLNLISKLFAIFIYKEYEKDVFEKNLSHDKLTNLYNYSKWLDLTYEYLYDNSNPEYAIIRFSFLNFMHLGDVLGAEACNEVLKTAANALREYSTENEIYCRTTEDRFIIITFNTNENYITDYIEKIAKYVDDNYKYGYHFILKAGVCINDGKDSLTETIDKANVTRKNALNIDEDILFFSDEFYEKQKIRNELEKHQNEALKNGEFLLYLQPKIDTKNNKIAGAEALTRWKYNHEKMIFPDTFIPLFEQNGFIKELDLHVFENVCKFQKSVIDSGNEPVTISVNLSMYQTNFDEYLEKINEIKDKYNVPAKYLEIEITESTYVKNNNNVKILMDKLHKNGYQISMDDFGTGYSNLSSLATFDFDMIKLDKNFCSNKENVKERTILEFVVRLAKSLNIKVLCEGVETKELVDFLRDIGCTLIQGYYFDKPMPAEDLKKKYLTK
ncbi:MAG: EAL domain-containing protein [Acholeplasmatales bacterium]|nr:EAL domain-containing protein [Acholeplasmatales bacterium]